MIRFPSCRFRVAKAWFFVIGVALSQVAWADLARADAARADAARANDAPFVLWAKAPASQGDDDAFNYLPENETTLNPNERNRAAFSADSNKVAFLVKEKLQVNRVAEDGTLGAPLYVSPSQHQITAVAWRGSQLFVSRKVGTRAETVSLLFATSPVPTSSVATSPAKKPAKPLAKSSRAVVEIPVLPLAAAKLLLSPDGRQLALVPSQKSDDNDTQILFYQLQKKNWVQNGSYRRAKTGALERFWKNSYFDRPQWLYLLGWNNASRGVFAVLPSVTLRDARDSVGSEPQICLVLPEGKAVPLSQPAAIGPYFRPQMLPLAQLVEGEGATAVPMGREFLSEFGVLTTPRSYLISTQPESWRDESNRGQARLIAYLPNTRYALQHRVVDGKTSELIVSDLEEERWKSLGRTDKIVAAYAWNGDRLLLQTQNTNGSLRWGMLRVSSSWLKQNQGWTKVPTSYAKPDAAGQAVLKFFAVPNVARYAGRRPFYDDAPDRERDNIVGFRFWERRSVSYIHVDTKLNRVTFYDGPDVEATLPAKPISSAQAREKAREFIRQLHPEWLQLSPQIDVAPLVPDANYYVRFRLATPSATPAAIQSGANQISSTRNDVPVSNAPSDIPSEFIVTVQAGSGNLSGYSEEEESLLWMRRRWQPTASSRPLPFDTLRPSPDGRYLLFGWNQAGEGSPSWWVNRPLGLYLLDLRTAGAKPQFIAYNQGAPSWSPDSSRFAFVRDGFEIYEVQTGKIQKVPQAPGQNLVQRLLGWKNSRELLFGFRVSGDGYDDLSGLDLRLYRLDEPARLPLLWKADWSAPFGYTGGLKAAATSPDGSQLAIAWEKVSSGARSDGDRLSIFIVSLDDKMTTRLLRTQSNPNLRMMWAKPGLLTWVGSASNGVEDVTLTDIENGTVKPFLLSPNITQHVGLLRMATLYGVEPGYRFSNDGDTVFFTGLESAQSPEAKLYRADANGQNVQVLLSHATSLR